MCPGRYFSKEALFLFTASLLSTFEVTPPKDKSGNFLPMEWKLEDMTVS